MHPSPSAMHSSAHASAEAAALRPSSWRTIVSEAVIASHPASTLKCRRTLSGQYPSSVVACIGMVVVVAVNVNADDFEEVAGVAVVAAIVPALVHVTVDVLVADVVVDEVDVNCSVVAMWLAAAEVGGTCPGNDLGAINLPPTFQRSETAAKLASGSCAKSMVNVCGCTPDCEVKPRRQRGGRMRRKESTRLDLMLAFTAQTSRAHWRKHRHRQNGIKLVAV